MEPRKNTMGNNFFFSKYLTYSKLIFKISIYLKTILRQLIYAFSDKIKINQFVIFLWYMEEQKKKHKK